MYPLAKDEGGHIGPPLRQMKCSAPASTHGISLLEVLVAMLILSIGLLGIAALQLNSMRATQGSYLQSVASVQLASMTERLQVNHTAAARLRESELWNQQNQLLLPKSKGSCVCNNFECDITLAWDMHHLTFKKIL